MIKNRTITINEREFADIMANTVATFIDKYPIGSCLMTRFGAMVHTIIFESGKYETANTDTDTDTPFKVGDEVFVVGNEGDENNFVNQVATVLKVENDDTCYVTNGDGEQWIYFKNLRKVLN